MCVYLSPSMGNPTPNSNLHFYFDQDPHPSLLSHSIKNMPFKETKMLYFIQILLKSGLFLNSEDRDFQGVLSPKSTQPDFTIYQHLYRLLGRYLVYVN